MCYRKILSVIIVICLIMNSFVLAVAVSSKDLREYTGQFSDVSDSDWFYENVRKAYSLNIINGKSETVFDPSGNVTIAEAIKLAAVVHCHLENGSIDDRYFPSLPNEANWYDTYLRYCRNIGIVTEDYANYNAPASRAQIAVLFSRVIIYTEVVFEDINEFSSETFKDVDYDSWYFNAFKRMYRTGIITGDEKGNINPDNNVKRSEMAAITIRMIEKESRVDVNKISSDPPVTQDTVKDDKTEDVLTGESILLYDGTAVKYKFSGLSFILGDILLDTTHITLKNTYEIENTNHIVLSENSFSFRILYDGGYDATAIIRGWLLNASSGEAGFGFNTNEGVFSLWLDGEPCGIEKLTINTDNDYIEYTFSFVKPQIIKDIKNVQFWIGRYNEEIGSQSGFDLLKEYVAPEHHDISGQVTTEDSTYAGEYHQQKPKGRKSCLKMKQTDASCCTGMAFMVMIPQTTVSY